MLIKVLIFALTGVTIVAHAEPPIRKACRQVIVFNHTDQWTNNDQRALNRARNRCFMIYPDAPCLKRFYKLESLRYTAICGN